jgi:hypothetical protein
MGIKLTGVKEAVARLKGIERVTPTALADALYVEGELIMTTSKRSWVPVDLGTLRASGRVERPRISGSNVSVELGFGGAAAAYALIQHERTDFNHPGQGRAKYLEGPVKEAAPTIGRKIARRLQRAWGR